MIRSFHLADWFTLGNAVCGVGSLFATINYIQDHGAEHVEADHKVAVGYIQAFFRDGGRKEAVQVILLRLPPK